MTKTQERAAVKVVNNAAFALVEAEAALMEERMGSYDVGDILDFVHEFVHKHKLTYGQRKRKGLR